MALDPAWVAALVALVVAVCTGVIWMGRRAWRILRRTIQFLDAWNGEPAHDGLEHKPSVMARLKSFEEQLAHLVAETTPNGGGSMRDVVARTAADVAEIRAEQVQVRQRLEQQQTGHGRHP